MSELGRLKELEVALETERQERAEAEQRARRANDRARDADEAYRKLQLELVAAKDEASAARAETNHIAENLAVLQSGAKSRRASVPPSKPAMAPALDAQLADALERIEGLRSLLTMASVELSQLHSDEVALGVTRTRVLSDTCALLARAVGTTGCGPPPLPSRALEARLSLAPTVDISEVADLIESMRPPKTPKVE